MTCIAAIEHEGRVWMGGDSAAVSGHSLTVRADQKVFRKGPYVMGFTSSFRMGQLLRYYLDVPSMNALGVVSENDLAFMSTVFIDSVRDCLSKGGYMKKENNQEEGGSFLVGFLGHIYMIASDFQVGRPVDGIAAVGCGADLALGALYVTKRQKPEKRINRALQAAERFSSGVRAPFTIEAV